MNTRKNHASIQLVGYILYKKYNDIILKDTTIKDLGDSANLLIKSKIFNNQHIYIYPSNIYVTGDLTFLVILLGKGHSSPE